MRSMKGTTMFRPGPRVAWYLPSRSTTHACCWGTTLMVLKTKTRATSSSTRVTPPNVMSIWLPLNDNKLVGSMQGRQRIEPVDQQRLAGGHQAAPQQFEPHQPGVRAVAQFGHVAHHGASRARIEHGDVHEAPIPQGD